MSASIFQRLVATAVLPAALAIGHDAGAMTPEKPPAEAQQLARFVFAGLQDSRERLKSGVFRAAGYLEETTEEPRLKGEITVFGAFDFAHGLLRFDRLEPMRVVRRFKEDGRKGRKKQGSLELGQVGGRFVRTNNQSIEWHKDSRVAAIRPAREKAPGHIRPFDVRLVGLTNWGTLDAGETWESLFPELQRRVTAMVREGETFYRATWIYAEAGVKIDCWFDARQGFSPVRLEQRTRPVKNPGDWREASETGASTWAKVGEVWVPKTLSQETKSSGGSSRREISFQWENVNQGVENALFTWQGMGLPKGTQVIDRRLGRIVPVGIVGVDLLPARDGLQASGSRFGRIVGVVCTIAVLAIVLLLIYSRRRRTTS